MKQVLRNTIAVLVIVSMLAMTAPFGVNADDKTALKGYDGNFELKYGEEFNLGYPSFERPIQASSWNYNGNKLVMKANKNQYYGHRASMCLGYEMDKRYDYAGVQISWNGKLSHPNYAEKTMVTANGSNVAGGQTIEKTLYEGNTHGWTQRDSKLYFDLNNVNYLYLANYTAHYGVTSTLNIDSIKPIKRPFEISVKQPQGFGNTYLEGSRIAYSGDQPTVISNNNYGDYTIKGLKIVHPTTGATKKIADRFVMRTYRNLYNMHFDLTNEFLTKYNDYIVYKDNGKYGKKGQIKVQAILGNVTPDDIDDNELNRMPCYQMTDGAKFRIRNVHSGLYLKSEQWQPGHVGGRVNAYQGYKDNSKTDIWQVSLINGCLTALVNEANGGVLVLDKNGGSTNRPNASVFFGTNVENTITQINVTLADRQNKYMALRYHNNGDFSCKKVLSVKGSSLNNGANVQYKDYKGLDSQKWVLEPVRNQGISNGVYRIKNSQTGHYVTHEMPLFNSYPVGTRGYVSLGSFYNPADADQWKVTFDNSGYCTIKNTLDNTYMVAPTEYDTTDYIEVIYGINPNDSNKFKIRKDADSDMLYNISAKVSGQEFFEAENSANSGRGRIYLAEKNSSHAQKWIFEKVSNDYSGR